MSRNSSGTYTLPTGNPVVSGTIIEASWANGTLSDIAAALTDSLSRSGQGGMTAPLRIIDGSVSVPSLAFANETGSGAYRAAAGDWGLTVLGSRIVRLRSSGADVTGALAVSGNITSQNDISTASGAVTGAAVYSTVGNNEASVHVKNTTSDVYMYNSYATNEFGFFDGTAGQPLMAYNRTASYWSLNTAGTQKMCITSVGNVGINNVSPAFALEVNSSISATAGNAESNIHVKNSLSDVYLYNSYLANVVGLYDGTAGRNLMTYNRGSSYWSLYTSGAERMRIDANGNVGIGASSAPNKLTIYDASSTVGIQISCGSVNNYVQTSATAGIFGTGSLTPVVFQTAATERMRIDSSGSVGIGDSSPSSSLTVAQAKGVRYGKVLKLATAASLGAGSDGPQIHFLNSGVAQWGMGMPGGDSSAFAWFSGGSDAGFGTERMRIDSSGNVGIGTNSPGAKLDVTGQIRGSGVSPSFASGIGSFAYVANGAYGGGYGLLDGSTAWGIYAQSGTLRFGQSGSGTGGALTPYVIMFDGGGLGVYTSANYITNGITSAGGVAMINDGGFYSGGVSYYNSAWRGLVANQPGWAIRNSSGVFDVQCGTTGGAAGNPLVNFGTKFKINPEGGFSSFTNSGMAFNVFSSGGDVFQAYQNRNGSSPYFFFNTSGTYGVFSDFRLKDDIVPLSGADAVSFVKGLHPVEFNWKEQYGNAEKRISGFLAQDALAAAVTEGQKNALTNWETYDENDPDCEFLGLSEQRILPSVVGALKVALAKIEALEAEVAALKSSAA